MDDQEAGRGRREIIVTELICGGCNVTNPYPSHRCEKRGFTYPLKVATVFCQSKFICSFTQPASQSTNHRSDHHTDNSVFDIADQIKEMLIISAFTIPAMILLDIAT